MIKLIKKLKQLGIMGLNQRNGDYILVHNPRRYYPLVDDKLKTKQLAIQAGISVPKLYTVIEIERQIADFKQMLDDQNIQDFVIKPANGSGGNGILVISSRIQERFRQASGRLIIWDDIDQHISNILSGMYSLGGNVDKAMVEYRIEVDPVFDAISFHGVPDIRIIVYLGYPIMAMVRLPTYMSEGKANLHQGAIGTGVNIKDGVTLSGVCGNEPIDQHPDTLQPIAGCRIPHWQPILEMAAQCYELTQLGYLGVDILLDKKQGPLMLELNARPGLNIQIANQTGLVNRCKRVDQLAVPNATPAQRAKLSRELF